MPRRRNHPVVIHQAGPSQPPVPEPDSSYYDWIVGLFTMNYSPLPLTISFKGLDQTMEGQFRDTTFESPAEGIEVLERARDGMADRIRNSFGNCIDYYKQKLESELRGTHPETPDYLTNPETAVEKAKAMIAWYIVLDSLANKTSSYLAQVSSGPGVQTPDIVYDQDDYDGSTEVGSNVDDQGYEVR